MLTLSLVFNIITNLSDKIKLENFSKLLSSSSMWILSLILALFLGVLELESSISTSVDKITVKTAETAVSNLVPVVGKFVSDSLEIVMGSTEIIGKAVGIITSIAALIPVIKIIVFRLIYYITSGFSEMLGTDNKISKLLESISKQYKILVGIMIGIDITYIIGTAIVINLIGKIYT